MAAKKVVKKAPAKKAVKKAVPAKKAVKKVVKKAAPAKMIVKKAPAKKAVKKAAPAKKVAKKAPAKKVAKKAPAKKAVPAKKVVKKAPAKKVAPAKKAAPVKAAKPVAAPKPEPKAAAKPAEKPAKAEPVKVEKPEVFAPIAAPVSVPGAKKKPVKIGSVKPAQPKAPAVREDESPWTAAELKGVRKSLLEEITRLEEELAVAEAGLADLIRDSGDGAGDDQADAGTKTFEREHEMSIAANARDMLDQVHHALDRLGKGTYGACESCGNPVGKYRLQAFPRATLCMACKQAEERA